MLQNYLRIAWRNLRSQRSYALLNVVGLALGMAGGLLIFLFVRYHYRTDRHHAKFDRIVRIVTDLHLDDGTVEYNPEAPLPMAGVLRKDYPMVEEAAFLTMNRELTVSVRAPGRKDTDRFLERETTALVEPSFFRMFDYEWKAGRPETALTEPNTVVLTESMARKYFGSANPLGRLLSLNHRTEVKVTGLLADPAHPTDTRFGIFISLKTIKALRPDFNPDDWGWINSTDRLYVTLRNPADRPRLEAAMPALAKKGYGESARYYRFHVQPLADIHYDLRYKGGVIRASLLGSLALIGLFLVVTACINFVNLATVQAFRRSREVGIRKALGSSRGQLARQFLLETGLIVLGAAGLAVGLAAVLLPFFSNWVQVPLSLRPDGTLVGFMLGLIGAVILLAGGYPAFVLSGFNPYESLRGKLTAMRVGGYSLRQGLVVLQFVVCQALLVGSLVVMRQVRYMEEADLGFRKDNVLILSLPDKKKELLGTFRNELAQVPEVLSVSFHHRPPSDAVMHGGSFKFGDKADWSPFPARERLADAAYVPTYGLKLLAGRNLTESDTIREYLVNEEMVRQLNLTDPKQILGRRLQYYLSPVPLPIVGVVRDFHIKSLRDAIDPTVIACHRPMYAQAGIRVTGHHLPQTLDRIRGIWAGLYPEDVFEYRFLDDQLAKFYEAEDTLSRIINAFALVAMVICGLGLYGLVSFVVGQRTKEIGIRKVLGATVAGIVALLTKDFVKLVLVAIAVASPAAWYVMDQWLQEFTFRISIGWWVFALAGAVALALALLTVSWQSVRAATANPVKSLRSE
ncbi:ABC transporter permease [Larkinella soli]|uniref:ABC transporter permease n=1 Tax=Larkinella soli TaxID=1770527 RepID=UPI000FFC0B2A|nr:ABC transporter permease [Larkinella soli]